MNHERIEFAQYKAQRIKELVPEYNQSGIKILDFGCGDGTMTNYLQEVFFDATVSGVDNSKSLIEQARTNYPHIRFEHLEKNIFDILNTHFDLIIASEVFHHIAFDEHQYYIDMIMRMLKQDGIFVLLELNPYNLSTLLRFKRDVQECGNRLLSQRYAYNLLKKYGSTQFYYFCFFPGLLEFLVFLEPWLIKVPVGQLYGVMVNKQK